ncbi:MAG: hypothetical protein JWO88_3961 [Frankiales bacterium]|nr:hypothetical protein [Frankiales bacterium]
MLVEMRTYTLHCGAIPAYLAAYQSHGMAVQLRHLPRLLGSFTNDIGPLNQVVFLWGYADFAERSRCRAALAQDPLWRPYVEMIREFIQTQENRILLPTSFSPMH